MQLWSGAMFIRGLVEGLWGLRPRADRDAVELSPQRPSQWKFMAIEGLRVGQHILNFHWEGDVLTVHHGSEGDQPLSLHLRPRGVERGVEPAIVTVTVAPGETLQLRWPG